MAKYNCFNKPGLPGENDGKLVILSVIIVITFFVVLWGMNG